MRYIFGYVIVTIGNQVSKNEQLNNKADFILSECNFCNKSMCRV